MLEQSTTKKPYFTQDEKNELRKIISACGEKDAYKKNIIRVRNLPRMRDLSFDEWMDILGKFLQEYIEFEQIDWSQVKFDLQKVVSKSREFEFKGVQSIEELEELLIDSSTWYHFHEKKPQPQELKKLATVLSMDVLEDINNKIEGDYENILHRLKHMVIEE
uniref:Uncharacterized protein n=1 Tax=Percolomonas cosmopolitus TaxID=63605 RepID=A0A7S1KRW7_9EUKA|mmetsp:Transcript_6752/g.25239  ORF Transcript_6752/g.25239 Transcript_6752/m.25239 type:complete len:162 (+) Transcript_6752:150-635(+)